MNILSVEKLSKSYGDKQLFQDISFGIEQGEKVGFIAQNGSGKSTLMRILAARDTCDTGSVTYRKGLRIGYVSQDPYMDPEMTILESVFHDGNEVVQLMKQYESLMEKFRLRHSEEMQKELERLTAKIDQAGAWDYETRVRQILSLLSIHNLDQKIGELSGGQRKRIALAEALIDPADILLLDEPTNHLDVEMVEWLEDYLTRSTLSLLLITHDRYFLENITDKIFELDNGKLYEYEGNYSYFLEKKEQRELNEEREKDKARNLLRTELEWMRRMPRARGTKSKSRIDSFYELKDKAAGKKKQEAITLDVKMNRIGGKVIEMKKVYKSFGDLPILRGFDYTFRTGEKIGIVGKNGCGKTTFLNMITGLEHADSGKINVGETIVFGYYSQQGLVLENDKRVIEVVRDYADVIQLSDGTKVHAAKFLQLFGFPPSMHHAWFSTLSGGEKRRLHLLTVLIKNPNFLILDEPTNDLDLLTLNVLEDFLMHYQGCLLIVSHDRYFMDKLADHLFIFEGEGKVRDFNGTYSEYRLEMEQTEKQAKKESQPVVLEKPQAEKKKKFTYKEKLEFEKLEKDIAALEEEKLKLTEKMSSGTGTHIEIAEWGGRLEEVMKNLDEYTMRWLELSELGS